MSDLIRLSSARRTTRATQHASWMAGGTLVVYDEGSGIPADSDTALTDQTALVTFSIPDPSGDVSDGIFTAGTISAAMIASTGTAAFARAYDASDVVIGDYDVAALGSGAAIELDNLSLVEGAYATITAFSLTEG